MVVRRSWCKSLWKLCLFTPKHSRLTPVLCTDTAVIIIIVTTLCSLTTITPPPQQHQQVRVAIIREEGSNGDREMAAAVFAAGMEPWDITMSDLIAGRAQLDSFRGIIFVGELVGVGQRKE